MKVVREGAVVILPRNSATVDVFTDKGWDNHAVYAVKDGQLKLVKGKPLNEGQQHFIGRCVLGKQYALPEKVEAAK
jgi:hypothetical protein